ncbi:hypothetical protein K8I61_02205 [bacterium]|nr:hypothetical protein [bacterium]
MRNAADPKSALRANSRTPKERQKSVRESRCLSHFPQVLLGFFIVYRMLAVAANAEFLLPNNPNWDFDGGYDCAFLYGGFDLNGDDFEDLVIDCGDRLLIFFGSTEGLTSDYNYDIFLQSAHGSYAIIGSDLNNDGYDDLVVPNPGWNLLHDNNGAAGRVVILYGDSLQIESATILTGDASRRNYGQVVADNIDVNGDGFGDLIIQYQSLEGTRTDAEKVVVQASYHGTNAGVSNTPSWIYSYDDCDALWAQITPLGDFNNDGYDDIAITCGLANPAEILFFLGSQYGLPQSPNVIINSDNQYFHDWLSVFHLGDVNGDGVDDLASTDSDIIYIFYGNNLRFDDLSYSKTLNLFSDDGSPVGPATLFYSNRSNSTNFNGDIFDDLIVTWLNDKDLVPYLGYITGSASGIQNDISWSALISDPQQLAISNAASGDVNGDGSDDLHYVGIYYSEFIPGEIYFWVFGYESGNVSNSTTTTTTSTTVQSNTTTTQPTDGNSDNGADRLFYGEGKNEDDDEESNIGCGCSF